MTPNERRAAEEYRQRELAQLAELEEHWRVQKFGGTIRPPQARPAPHMRCTDCGRTMLAKTILANGNLCRRCAAK